MSYRRIISLVAVTALAVADLVVATDAFAARAAGRVGASVSRGGPAVSRGGIAVSRGGGYNRGNYRGGYFPGAGLAAGAVLGGAIAASRPWYGYNYGYDNGQSYYDQGYYGQGYYGQGYYGYNPGYYSYYPTSDQSAAYCAQRYRSYDAASGTYLGYDGQRHPCP